MAAKERLTKKIRNLITGKESGKMSLDNLFTSKESLVTEYVNEQNSLAIQIASMMLLFLNVMWTVYALVSPVSGPTRHMILNPLEITGMGIASITSIFMLFLLNARKEPKQKTIRVSTILFHIALILEVMLLEVSKANSVEPNMLVTGYNGVALVTFLLILGIFVPLTGKVDSLIYICILCAAQGIANGLAKPGTYAFTENLLIRICLVFGYLAFRGITLKNANMINVLSEASYKDFQTKTLNRMALSEYLEKVADKDINTIGVMKFNVDDFKSYNDKYSHAKGDIVLARMCEAIIDSTKEDNALVFRYGGDEFIAIIEDPSGETLVRTALKIRDTVQNLKIQRNDNNWNNYVSVTIGCTLASKYDCSERDIIGEADSQMFIGKKGTNNCVVFKGRIHITEGEISMEQQPTQFTDRIAQAANEAMRKNRIRPYYQPLYDTKTQKLVGAEALARWVKEDGTIIRPVDFVPELEKNSSILSLDWYMYEEVCRTLRRQKNNNIPQVRISVNFSRMHALYERDISKRLSQIADKYEVPHDLLEIEITESAYIKLPNIEPFVRSIRAEGFTIAVDDFGTGASSLGFVKNVDVDTLKIDKSLITTNVSDEKERVLLESVVMLAQRLQLNSVAEGVETMEQLGFLKTLGCNQVQGYIFALPMPEKDFFELLGKQDVADTSEIKNVRMFGKNSSLSLLVDTVFKRYPVVVMANITRNSFYTMTYDTFINHSFIQSGLLTDLIEDIATTVHPDDIQKFRNVAEIQNQQAFYDSGKDKFSIEMRIKGETDTEYKTVENSTYYIKQNDSDDLLTITLCKELEK